MDNILNITNNSWLGRLDPRIKIISLTGFIAIMVSSNSRTALIMSIIFLLTLGMLSGTSPSFFVKRLLWALPFVGFMVILMPFIVPGTAYTQIIMGPLALTMSYEGLSRALLLTLRMTVGLFALTLLISTTGLGKLMLGLRQLHVPYVFVAIVEFTIRYIFVLLDELKRMNLARKARGFESGRSFLHRRTFLTLGNQVATLFLRANSRGERIYQAMLARGYCGETTIKKPWTGFKPLELGWGLGVLAMAIFLQTIDIGGWQWLMSLK